MGGQGSDEAMPWEGYGEATEGLEAQAVADLPGMAPFEGEQIKTRDLLGRPFFVLKARSMRSTKGKGGHFYAVQAKDEDTDELFTTLLGGVAVVKVIDTWLRQTPRRPLRVTLSEVEGGEFGHYYILS